MAGQTRKGFAKVDGGCALDQIVPTSRLGASLVDSFPPNIVTGGARIYAIHTDLYGSERDSG